MSQFVRDARIAMIYEGANGVQDLVDGPQAGRRRAANDVMAFFWMVKGDQGP